MELRADRPGRARVLCAAVCALAAFAAVGWAVYQHGRKRGPLDSAHAGRYVERAAVMFRLLAPEQSALTYTATPNVVKTRTGDRDFWVVEARDPTGRFTAHVIWNAVTGDVIEVSRPSVKPKWDRRRALNATEAVGTSGQWLRKLGVAARAPHWQLAGAPEPCGGSWIVHWQGQDRTAMVNVDSLSGNLNLLTTASSPHSGLATAPNRP